MEIDHRHAERDERTKCREEQFLIGRRNLMEQDQISHCEGCHYDEYVYPVSDVLGKI